MSTDKKSTILQNNPLDGMIPDLLHQGEGQGRAVVPRRTPLKKATVKKDLTRTVTAKPSSPKTGKSSKAKPSTETQNETTPQNTRWRLSLDEETIKLLDDMAFDLDCSRTAVLQYLFTQIRDTLSKKEITSKGEEFRDFRGKNTGRKYPTQIQSSSEMEEHLSYFQNLLRIRSRSEIARVLVRLWKSMD
jgi:hypothetical protein